MTHRPPIAPPDPAVADAARVRLAALAVPAGLRLGEGSGAVAAVPVLHSAVAPLRDVALLSELMTHP